jgi:hypothetical protein
MSTSVSAPTIGLQATGAVFGTGTFGGSVFGSGANATQFVPVSVVPSNAVDGRTIQTIVQFAASTEVVLLGYIHEVSSRLPVL